MSPNRNMRSIFAQCRNFSKASRSRRNLSSTAGSSKAMFLIQGTGGILGLISGYYFYGGKVAKYEELRQQIEIDVLRNPEQVEDLRTKMWPEFRKMALFTKQIVKMWSDSEAKCGEECGHCVLRRR
ncbi:PREDICTED: uncharacterized protein LOC104745310 [Camelina sativa]|uniref:Uncharacterized protein LOC104745310 n=1 Tax=Camelina sativa TaxID=90675 RepID=A0ABM0W2M1_CAMSA|nr:PREDICTED: uncharacterized protein LOC104745310 [Camelina sativa]